MNRETGASRSSLPASSSSITAVVVATTFVSEARSYAERSVTAAASGA